MALVSVVFSDEELALVQKALRNERQELGEVVTAMGPDATTQSVYDVMRLGMIEKRLGNLADWVTGVSELQAAR